MNVFNVKKIIDHLLKKLIFAINLGLIANGGFKGEVEKRKTWETYDCLCCANSINFKVMFQKVT
jgi:hypothetical protein